MGRYVVTGGVSDAVVSITNNPQLVVVRTIAEVAPDTRIQVAKIVHRHLLTSADFVPLWLRRDPKSCAKIDQICPARRQTTPDDQIWQDDLLSPGASIYSIGNTWHMAHINDTKTGPLWMNAIGRIHAINAASIVKDGGDLAPEIKMLTQPGMFAHLRRLEYFGSELIQYLGQFLAAYPNLQIRLDVRTIGSLEKTSAAIQLFLPPHQTTSSMSQVIGKSRKRKASALVDESPTHKESVVGGYFGLGHELWVEASVCSQNHKTAFPKFITLLRQLPGMSSHPPRFYPHDLLSTRPFFKYRFIFRIRFSRCRSFGA